MKPLAVSMGDPAGIGLELAARVWAERDSETPPFVFYGDANALARAAARLGVDVSALPVEHQALAAPETPGSPNTANAPAIIAAIEHGVAAVRDGRASALVTLPIAKHVLQAAGFGFPGHTEFVAHLTRDIAWRRARGPVMMLAGASLKVALATIHTPLAQVASALSRERITQVATIVHEALLHDFGVARPRIALCGLNPHAGENGNIGREEIEIINPAAAALRALGVPISDAQPADSLFHDAAREQCDAVIALYHDQGLIPLKTLHFWDAVNVTLGLPIVRASPDHGTGFDIAGKGLARADSFRAALKGAWDMARRRAWTADVPPASRASGAPPSARAPAVQE
jgi:4-hydroxythreonine-4-phosphate dehydrogenase